MSNLNSVYGFASPGTTRNTFPAQAIAATAETILTIGTDTGTANYFLVAPSGGQIYGSNSGIDPNGNPSIIDRSNYITGLPSGESNDQFNSTSWSGRRFKVRITGTGTAGHNGAQTVLINLYQGTSATLGSDSIIATTGAAYAVAQGATNVNFDFSIEATLQWSVGSQLLSGFYTANVAGGTTSQIKTPTVLANLPAVTSAAGLSFLATVTMGNAAASTIQISEFLIDRI